MAMPTADEILATYARRESQFEVDGAGQELGRQNADGLEINRPDILFREVGSASVSATLDRVQYGTWEGKKACLISLSFAFFSGSNNVFRFTKAEVEIALSSRTSSDPRKGPAIQDYGPKFLKSVDTSSEEHPSWNVKLSCKADILGLEVGPELETGKSSTYTRHYAQEVSSTSLYSRRSKYPCRVLLCAKENVKQEKGVPVDIRMTVIFTYSSDSQATVKVSGSALFEMLARPWTADDPILLDETLPWGKPIREQNGVDFATLTEAEWRGLVTPDLVVRNELHQGL